MSAHESFDRAEQVEAGSNRAFGLVFAGFFAIVGLWPLVFRGDEPRWWALALALAFVAVALLRPAWLARPNHWWMRFGLLLNRVVSPLVMGLLFYAMFTPFGVVMRLMGKDPLHRRFEAGADSYWIRREPPGPPPDTMKNQF